VATAADSFLVIFGLLPLSSGRVIVNDLGRRQVALFDSTLRESRPLIDNTGSAPRRYTGLLTGPYRGTGDSTVLYDASAQAMLVLDASGTIARVTAPPFAVVPIAPAGDGRGHLVFALNAPDAAMPDSALGAGGRPIVDSLLLIRADLTTRRTDTIAKVAEAARYIGAPGVDSCGIAFFRTRINPLPSADGWAVLSNGTVAVVRARDLHIDWIGLDGTTSASPKLPHEWHRLTDSDKVALVDSLKTRPAIGPAAPLALMDPRIPPACRTANIAARMPDFPEPANLADYAAPFPVTGGVFADADDDLWIQTDANPSGGVGPVYLVVDTGGAVIDRVQIPGGTTIAGFAPGIVFLKGRTGGATRLVEARIR